MTSSVVVIDYGIGNVYSVCQAIRHAGGEPVLTDDHSLIAKAERLILPGVGAFGRAVEELRRRGLDTPIKDFCSTGRPFLGVCVGMQVMVARSTELGEHRGLGLLPGVVDRIPGTTVSGGRLRVPHIGWSELHATANTWAGTVLDGVAEDQTAFYFLHSYAVSPASPGDVLAEVEYGGHRLTAAITRDNLTGVQFHPERSGPAGQAVLARFLNG